MNKDIAFDNNDYYFNFRVAVIIRNNNKILVQKDDRVSYLALPGGRVSIGETNIETAIREFKEETNIDCTFKKDLGVIENFFTSSFNNKKYHEILFVIELSFNNPKYYQEKIINNVEEKHKDHLRYIWIDKDELSKMDFRPKIILEFLDSKEFVHKINNEINKKGGN